MLESLPVGMIAMQLSGRRPLCGTTYRRGKLVPVWMDDSVYGSKPTTWLEDPYSLWASYILTNNAPYYGDQFAKKKLDPTERFSVIRIEEKNTYLISDALMKSQKKILKEVLANPHFDLAGWYDKCRARHYGRKREARSRLTGQMGDALAIVTERMLQSGVRACYPNVRPSANGKKRFKVSPVDDGEVYRVYDSDILEETLVPRCVLEDPSVSLVGWYMDKLARCKNYEYWYVEELLCVTDEIREAKGLVTRCQMEPLVQLITSSPDFDVPNARSSSPNLDTESNIGEVTDEWSDLDGFESESALDGETSEDIPDGNYGSSVAYHIYEASDLDKHLRILEVLTWSQPFPGDPCDLPDIGPNRFAVALGPDGYWEIYDRIRQMETYLHQGRLENGMFSLGRWYAEFCASQDPDCKDPWISASNWLYDKEIAHTLMGTLSKDKCDWYGFEYPKPRERITEVPTDFVQRWKSRPKGDGTSEVVLDVHDYELAVSDEGLEEVLVGLRALQVDRKSYAAIQRNSATVKDKTRLLPKPVVLKVKINGHAARALVDSGSQGDFVSSTLADQLGLKRNAFSEPLKLQLAVQGSRSVINAQVEARFQFGDIDEPRVFDVVNLNNYDIILGTPWMYQHRVCVGLNPARILIGSKESVPIKKGIEAKPLANAIGIDPGTLEAAREELMKYADPICKEVAESDFPPLRVINHTIPLIDEHKTYPWRPSRCPEVFRSQWTEKRDAYLKSGRWEITAAGNTVPMMLIPNLPKRPSELRIVVDLRERNKNTRKMTSPMPDMEGMLRRASQHPYRSALDLKGAYEQIRIVPEHVHRTAVTTPDGNMVSHVIQQGDCNAPATYQALMNHIFSALIGRCMDVYLDDIVVYSSTLEQHISDVKSIIDILRKEKLYLSKKKLRFLAPEVDLLGHLIDDDGIRMDPNKVDSVTSWKTPTNRDLLRGFLGSVGYLADDVPGVRIPMGILSGLTGDATPFRWTYTEQRTFEDVKRLVQAARDHRRRPLDYSEGAPQIWMVPMDVHPGSRVSYPKVKTGRRRVWRRSIRRS